MCAHSPRKGKSLSDFLEETLYPALYPQLDSIFPEFGWKKQGRSWIATTWPEDFPYEVEHPRPDRLVIYEDAPWFIKVHGHSGLTVVQYLSGGSTPRGAAFREVLKKLAAKAGVNLPEKRLGPKELKLLLYHEERRRCLEVATEMGQVLIWETLEGNPAIDYLIDRGFSEDLIEELGMGLYRSVEEFEAALKGVGCDLDVAKEAGLTWSMLEGYILVPWMDAAGAPLTIYGRWPEKVPPEGRPKTIALPGKGTKGSPLYFDRARQAGHSDLVAVEGVFDAALLQARGETRVIAYVAAQFSRGQVATLSKYRINSVTIVPDPDGGGDRGAVASVDMLERVGIRSYVAPRLPDGLDPDEFLVRDGLEAWRAHVERAVPGAVHKAKVLLQKISPNSSEIERRSCVEKVSTYAAGLTGKWGEEDRRQIIELAAASTGFSDKTISELFTRDSPQQGETEGFGVPLDDPHLTDLGNARRLAERHGQDLKYIAGLGWFVWDGVRWLRDETGEVERRAKETILALYQEAGAIVDDDARGALIAHARRSESAFRIAAMVNLARSELQVVARTADLDADPFLLNVQNGTVNLRTGDLLPHRRDDMITKLAPVEYLPEAECPKFLAFMNEIFNGNENLTGFVQRAMGYALTGDVSEQVFFYLYGTGANGKSTLLLVLMHLLGDYAQQAAPNILVAKKSEEHPTAVADLLGARLVVTTEIESGRSMAESLIKQITGGDKLKARYMRQDFFQFDPTFKVFLAANHKLVVKGTDNAIWRRIRLVPFTTTIPEGSRDKNLLEKLKAESSGILAWAVRGGLQWQSDGLGTPSEVTAATDEYRSQMDILAQFITECCIVDKSRKVGAGALYAKYVNWCGNAGEYAVSQRVFGGRLSERGFAAGKGSGGTRVRLGLALKAVAGGAGSGPHFGKAPYKGRNNSTKGKEGPKGHNRHSAQSGRKER